MGAAFHLPGCPLCSSIETAFRPYWRRARFTSEKNGVETLHIVGCRHAEEIFGSTKRYANEEEIGNAEDAWAHWVETAFLVRTEKWPALSRDKLRREVLGQTQLAPGTIEPLNL